MHIKKKKILSDGLILLILISMITFYICNIQFSFENNWVILIGNLTIIILAIIEIIKDKNKFSLNKCFWYFNLFFFGITPIFQVLSTYYPWGYYIPNYLFEYSNVVLLMWMIVYKLTYTYSNHKYKDGKAIYITKNLLNICFILSIFSVIILIILVGGINNLFARATNNIDLGDNLVNSIITKLIRSIPAYALVISILARQRKIMKVSIIRILLLLLFTILNNFPTSVTRYWMGTIFIGIILVIMKEKIKSRWFDYLMILVFAILFPFSYIFKWINISDLSNINIQFDFQNVYNSVDFDAYSLISRIVMYVKDYGFTLGKQVSASAFFFVPRALWQSKPYPTGVAISAGQGADFTNLSSPLVAEAYVDFGFVGIIIYAFILARVIKRMDLKYWNITGKDIYYKDIFYPFLIGFSIFLFRGSLQPVVTHMFAFFLFLIMIYVIQIFIYGRKNGKN